MVTAGSNGAGKSTLSAILRVPGGIPVLDPDAVARTIRPDASDRAAAQAGREVLRLQRQFLAQGQSFAVETTLAGSASLRLMEEARRQGFIVHLVYIGLEDAQIAIDRISVRVAGGVLVAVGGMVLVAVDADEHHPTDALTSTPNATFTYTAVSTTSEGPSWTYTTVLNIVYLVVAACLPMKDHGSLVCGQPRVRGQPGDWHRD